MVVLGAAALGGGAAIAVASVPGSDGVIHACVDATTNPGGQTVPRQAGPNLTIIDPDAGQKCIPPDGAIPNQTAISWSVTGLQGPTGSTGAPGPAGPSGPAGETGATGNPGAGDRSVTNSVTIAPPTLSANAKPIAEITIGSGTAAPQFPILALEQAGVVTSQTVSTNTKFHDLSITKNVDKASPRLLQLAATGVQIPKVTIAYANPSKISKGSKGSTKQEYLTITLSPVFVSSFQTQAGTGTAWSRGRASA